MTDFYSQIQRNVESMKAKNIKTVFTIATTSKQEDEPYITPVRFTENFVVSGCVIFEQTILLKLIELVDGKVDFILVDSEKKIPLTVHENEDDLDDIYRTSNTYGLIETGNLSKICFQKVKKSKIFEYKPNDLTVNATWLFLSQRLNFLSGKKISILGAGNIGSKLALKFVESGVDVHTFRKNAYKGHVIAHGLNFIKPENTVSNIIYHEDIVQTSFMADVLIGATNGVPVIDENVIKAIKKGALIVDLGKNTLTSSAIKYALDNKIEIYRTDVTSSLEGFIYEVIKMDNILENSYGKKDLGYCTIIGGGYFGANGDIVVNKINNPTTIIGVSAGNGSLKKQLSPTDIEKIDRLKKEIKDV